MDPDATGPSPRRLPFGIATPADVAIAVGLGAMALLGVGMGDLTGASPNRSAEYVLVVAMFAPLAWRTTHPKAVAVAVSAVAASLWVVVEVDWHTAVAGAIALYGLGHYVERPTSQRWFAAVLAALAAVAVALALFTDVHDGWFSVVARTGLVVAAFWYGDAQRSRDLLMASLQERAERAEEHRRVVANQAVLDERNRIAREMHDVVAHSLSVMVVQASAAVRLTPHDPDGAIDSMEAVADVGRSAMGEMRHILGLLDDDSAAPRGDRPGHGGPGGPGGSGELERRAPQPGLDALEPLVERYRQAGLDVTTHHPDPLPNLPAATALAVVRIVQEGLTNALNHAPGAAVTVALTVGDHVEIEVANDAPTGTAITDPRGSSTATTGRGLIGMRQRVQALDGQLHAGPGTDGGFVVRAALPAVRPVDVGGTRP